MLFEPTEGLDPDTCKYFNDYTMRLRTTFEGRMVAMSAINAEMAQKLAFYQSDTQVSDLTALELIGMAFMRGEDAMNIWHEFKRNTNEETLNTIAEREFEEIISEITKETV
jgi:hypothetical protein